MLLLPLLALFLNSVLSKPENGTQIISIAQAGCNFVVNTSGGSFAFLTCNTPTSTLNSNWTACLGECCPQVGGQPSRSVLLSCQQKQPVSQNISMTTIIIFAVIAIIAFTIFLCFCGIIMRLLKSLYRNRVAQEAEDTLVIEWNTEQQYLTTDPSQLKWCRKGIPKSRFDSDCTCSICLEQAPNAELYCRHAYHPQCIALWLKKSNFCPLCHREDIRSVKVYCQHCQWQYVLLRKAFLMSHLERIEKKCPGCTHDHKDMSIEVEDIEFPPSQQLVFEFSSENLASPH